MKIKIIDMCGVPEDNGKTGEVTKKKNGMLFGTWSKNPIILSADSFEIIPESGEVVE